MKIADLQDIFKVLGNESRLRILQLLRKKSYCGEELAQMLQLSSATISHHMKKLEDVGLISAKKDQYYTNYYVNQDYLMTILQSDVLQHNGDNNQAIIQRHEEYHQKIIKDFFTQQGKLKSIPSQMKKREVVLKKIVDSFAVGQKYSEKEVNLMLAMFHDDFCTLRRELIIFKLMERKAGTYWRVQSKIKKRKEEFTLDDLIRVIGKKREHITPEEKVAKIAVSHRMQNTPGFDQALDDMAKQLLNTGVTTRIECFQSDGKISYQDYLTPGGWVPKYGQLSLADSGEILADYQTHPMQLIQRSCSTDGLKELEIFLVEDIEKVIVESPDLSGKILLTNENVQKVKDLLCDPLGAEGIIFDGLRAFPGRDPEQLKEARQYTAFWWQPDEKPIFGFVISPAMGERIREQISSGRLLRVKCEVQAEFIDRPLKVLSASIPGKSEENLLLVAHICHPYSSVNDNASGAGAAVEVMLLLHQMISEKILPTPVRGIELILVPEYSGTFAFLDRYLNNKKYLAGVNLDMVGEDQKKCGSTLRIEAPPASIDGITGDLLHFILNHFTKEHGFRLKKELLGGGSDHMIMSDPQVGIPCVMLNQQPDRFYHTDQDTLNKLDPVILQDVTLSTAVYLYYLANLRLEEIQDILEIYFAAFTKLVKAQIELVLEKSKTENLPNHILPYCNRWVVTMSERYINVLDYFQKFITPEEFNYFQKISHDWRKRCTSERSSLLKEMNQILLQKTKADPQLTVNQNRTLNQLDRDLTKIVPERKYWGFTRLSQKRHLIAREELSEFWEIIEKDNNLFVLAQYWADGQRNLFEIMELVEIETGRREPELIDKLFKFLAKVGSVDLKIKGVKR